MTISLKTRPFASLLAASLCINLLAVEEANALSFNLTEIPVANNELFSYVGVSQINDSGTMLFGAAVRSTGQSGIFTVTNEGLITPIVLTRSRSDDTLTEFTFDLLYTRTMNNGGTVAFIGNRPFLLGDGIYTGNGGPLTTVATAEGSFYDFQYGGLDINDSGTVVFGAVLDNGNRGVFTSSNGVITTIAEANGLFRFFDQLYPTINNSGTVAFQASLDNGILGIFTASNGAITTIADSSGSFSYFLGPEINNEGTILFPAGLDNGLEGLFTSSNGAITAIADSSGTFSGFHDIAINDRGMIIFEAILDGPRTDIGGIYAGPDPIADKVIAVGDTLLGSTVTRVDFAPGSMNNSGQFTFYAELTDSKGTVRSTSFFADPVPMSVPVPEPSSALGLLGMAIFGTASVYKRQKQHRV
jgi:hypothetical protein